MLKHILIFGATGRTGQLVLKFALEKGYKVTALVRNPDKIDLKSYLLTVVKGSPTNIEDVSAAIVGCDAVISLLSALPEKQSFSFIKTDAPHTLENSIANALNVMKANRLKRIMILSSIGAGDSYRYAPWFMKVMFKITNFKIVFADHNAQEKLVQQAGLDWTIARPVALNNQDALGKLIVTYDSRPKPFKMSRKQLAKFFIDNLYNEDYYLKAPVLSER
jgi:uncharacterized protein YbjT (DUF2867 family)